MSDAALDAELVLAVADLRGGTVVRFLTDAGHPVLERFAAVVPELYSADRGAWAYGAFERARVGSTAARLDDLVVVAPPSVHVVLRLSGDESHVLLAVGGWQENVGAVVGAARARRAALEEGR
jgi:hypothetical protein